MREIQCPYCKYTWTYKGAKKVKVQCPDCLKRIELNKF